MNATGNFTMENQTKFKWRAVYIERCTCGSGGSSWKPTKVIQKGAGFLPYYLGDGKFLHDGSTKGVWINSLLEPYWAMAFNGNVRRIID